MRICILCEGRTEKAFKPFLIEFLKTRLGQNMPKLDFSPYDGAIPTETKLARVVANLLNSGRDRADAVIALTDIYPAFETAAKAKEQMRQWVGAEPRFHPHVALHDFEAWLLPYWDRIQKLAGRTAKPFGKHPELVNHNNPPAHRLKEFFEAGKCRDSYSKPRDTGRILRDADLLIAINACPEMKAFINTVLRLSGGEEIA